MTLRLFDDSLFTNSKYLISCNLARGFVNLCFCLLSLSPRRSDRLKYLSNVEGGDREDMLKLFQTSTNNIFPTLMPSFQVSLNELCHWAWVQFIIFYLATTRNCVLIFWRKHRHCPKLFRY